MSFLKRMIRPLMYPLTRSTVGRRLLVYCYDLRRAYQLRFQPDPVDVAYGINTVGRIPGYVLVDGSRVPNETGYEAASPRLIRRCLSLVSDPGLTTLLDPGCGKGRVLAVGSEFPFRELVGVELSDVLVANARINMAAVRSNFPGRPPIQVVSGDAVEYPFPAGRLAIFLYNPFGEALTKRFVQRLEDLVRQHAPAITIIYANPVWFEAFDDSPFFIRETAFDVPIDDEVGRARTDRATVVVWRDLQNATREPSSDAQRRVIRVNANRAELAPLQSPC